MSDITVNNFKAFYEQIRPYLGAVHSGFTPIGTVISVMGTTAPLNYLACDGTVYNISDYSELAAYFNQQFGSSNFFGGNGTTTFAVPDLRGEFIRGWGTNSHANQGNGADVGVHQDGTEIPDISFYNGTTSNVPNLAVGRLNDDAQTTVAKADKILKTSNTVNYVGLPNNTPWTNRDIKYTSRPTNTSLMFVIASKNIFMDAGMNYSTEEQVVGTWIDGKPIYQKTVDCGALPNNTSKNIAHGITNLNILIDVKGAWANNSHTQYGAIPYIAINTESASDWSMQVDVEQNNIVLTTIKNWSTYSGHLTLQYTKTTD